MRHKKDKSNKIHISCKNLTKLYPEVHKNKDYFKVISSFVNMVYSENNIKNSNSNNTYVHLFLIIFRMLKWECKYKIIPINGNINFVLSKKRVKM